MLLKRINDFRKLLDPSAVMIRDHYRISSTIISEEVSHLYDKQAMDNENQWMETSLSPFSSSAMTGLHFFGLNEPWVTRLIEQQPFAVQCKGYKFQFIVSKKLTPIGSPIDTSGQSELPLVINESGCARSEICRKKDCSATVCYRYVRCGESSNQDSQIQTQGLGGGVGASSLSTLENEQKLFRFSLPHAMQYRQTKGKQEHLRVMRSSIAEFGLFTTRPIAENEMIIEYTGEIIRKNVADKREKKYESRGFGCYMFKIKDDEIIDATMKGNKARFINHSCDPNAFTRVIFAEGKNKIMIFARRAIGTKTNTIRK